MARKKRIKVEKQEEIIKDMKKIIISVLAVISIILLGIFAVQGVQDRAYALEEKVKESSSAIKVQEKRRVDLVYNLSDCVKQYDIHEAETLKAIIQGRNKEQTINDVNTLISAVSEAYPELKSSSNYKKLMNELAVTENLIAGYRENYNSQVETYNRYTRKFLNRKCLHFLGYEKQSYDYLSYEVSSDAPSNLFGER